MCITWREARHKENCTNYESQACHKACILATARISHGIASHRTAPEDGEMRGLDIMTGDVLR